MKSSRRMRRMSRNRGKVAALVVAVVREDGLQRDQELARALDTRGPLGVRELHDQEAGEDADDQDHRQELDQGEALPARPLQEVVRATRSGHRRAELGHAQHGGNGEDSGYAVGEHR